MGRRRKSNKHLPQRVYPHHGRYWFIERSGKRRDLGTSESQMYSKLAEFATKTKPLHTMSEVFDRYLKEALANLAPRTQRDYRSYVENLRRSFGEAAPQEVTANSIYDYRAARARQSIVQANREISCLSAIFREAIGWHAVARNPCHELKRLHEQKRTRYVTDQEPRYLRGLQAVVPPHVAQVPRSAVLATFTQPLAQTPSARLPKPISEQSKQG